ncbi:MAG TPA: alpha-isopropylmalate synthase regulatory domain-containing protein [Spirochaetota bacterium]|nr:alpha-isopropylmalate synthase regulatory domain-containing protein [Spirochaetota bacterium]HOM37973.1 alpha-isopropylmalate synthase regulatory domain-containing protein [Spirochaetota bacterium]HPQ48778.1 alpha-isopropylmalate synthase regulatory domain-containing protein [Spirochaetota bacterium]
MVKKIEIMDTTLRDGEQMANVSYTEGEKINIVNILLNFLKVDRIELTSARVADSEFQLIRKIVEKFGQRDEFEILGFVDMGKSIDWIYNTGVRVINLLTKGSLKHLSVQLKKTPEEHLSDILKEIDYAMKKGMKVNVYLEDWSNGMIHSKDYVFFLIENLKDRVNRIMLPDTLGVLVPENVFDFIKELKDIFPDTNFDFHPHNDYGLGTANCLAAIRAGVDGLHVTVNGMGERAGNAPLEEVVVAIKDFYSDRFYTTIDEKYLYKTSKTVQLYSTVRMAANKPIVGDNVFTQTAGVHADGDKKGNLYENKLNPARFGREREYALGKLSGKANLEHNLKKLGIYLNEEEKAKVLQKIVEFSALKHVITLEDLPYIIDDILESKEIKNIFSVVSYVITSSHELKPIASIMVKYKDTTCESISMGDGGFDAFFKALKIAAKTLGFTVPNLVDYYVNIPPGGSSEALVQTTISWEFEGKEYKTKGVHSDQLMAAIKATEKAINIIELKKESVLE